MILTCPSCTTRYLVDPAQLAPRGRTVRCAKCGETWHQDPPADLPLRLETPLPPSFTQPASEEPKLPALVRRRQVNPGIYAMVAVLVLAGIAAFAYYGRPWLVERWPALDKIYVVLGIAETSPVEGLVLEGVNGMRNADGSYVVTGAIVNNANVIRAVPRLKGIFRDASWREIVAWTFTPAGEPLRPGERLPFQDSYANPPEGAANLLVTFDTAP